MERLENIDSSNISDLFQGSVTNLLPESLVNTITTALTILTVLSILFVAFYIFSTFRKWKVDSAIIQMQKDVAELKSHSITPKSSQEVPKESTK